jgi:glutamine amidotransferase
VIAVVDYGRGNLGSVTKSFRHVGAETVLSGDLDTLRRADALILPGDGAFGATMDEVKSRGLVPLLKEAAAQGKPLLGICIGMQVLFEESEEHGHHAGLGLLPGRVRRFDGDLPVPHMGWNEVRVTAQGQGHPLLDDIPDASFFYFVHSFVCVPDDADWVIAETDYPTPFASILGRGNLMGTQFHPEKSGDNGLRLLANFVEIARRGGVSAATAPARAVR